MIYLDNAATAKYTNVDDIIINTMVEAMRDSWMNPSSLYAASVKDKINKCRANIAKFINTKPEEIYFCSGASEANNWAIRGWVSQVWRDELEKEDDGDYYAKPIHVVVTPIEHKSILSLLDNESLLCFSHSCVVDSYGMVILESLEQLLKTYKGEPILVSVCMANNEIGVIQNIKKISELVHKYDGFFHVDATQALGKIPIDVEKLGVDMLSASGHKISPVLRGIGFLYKRSSVNIRPLIYGAQEQNLRGGTENTYGIIGLSKALEYCDISIPTIETLTRKRDYFIDYLKFKFGCKLNGHPESRLPNNVNVTFSQNIAGESLLYLLDMSDIRISTGSACNSKSIEPSHVLTAIGLSETDAMKTVRFTLPDDITYEEIDKVIEEIDKCLKLIEMEN